MWTTESSRTDRLFDEPVVLPAETIAAVEVKPKKSKKDEGSTSEVGARAESIGGKPG